jgi:two-component system, NtrC family, nitrogen regulation response regulator GlnG
MTTPYPCNPILLVDDEVQALNSFEIVLRSSCMNHFVRCQDSRQVIPTLMGQQIEAMLLDLAMPNISGEELLVTVSGDFPEVPVIIITGANDVETAVRCMKAGAFDYMVKPVEKSRLIAGVKRAIELRELQRENRKLKAHILSDQLRHPEAFSDIVTQNSAMRSIFQYIEAVATSPQPVLITGETGVGKELIAKAVHGLSSRAGAVVAVNVAGLDDNVFADTLFGHRRGAFTGADQARAGLVEQAAGGTLFLDEIGDLSSISQVKLLRLVQDGSYLPLGSDVAKRSDARIVVATNQDVRAMLEAGRFRRDLYYRLCTHHIHVPPLRDRRDDLPLLADHFLEKASESLGRKKPTPPPEFFVLLSAYSFPGNVRELEAMIFDALSSHKSRVLSLESFKGHIFGNERSAATALPRAQPLARGTLSFSGDLPSLKHAENLLIAEAMKRSRGNQAIAASMLGITRQALNRRLRLGRNQNDGSGRGATF